MHDRIDPPLPRGAVAGFCLAVVLLLLAGCSGSRAALLEAQQATIDSLQTRVAFVAAERDSLRTALDTVRARVDTLTIYVRQDEVKIDSLLALAADSLQRVHVLQFIQGQEQSGQLRGKTMEVIYFGSGERRLSQEGTERVRRRAARLRRLPPAARILVEGHTDDVPFSGASQQNNRVLSAERADIVRRHLLEHSGLDPVRFETAGFGADMPLFSNDNPALRRFNRRVRIAVLEP